METGALYNWYAFTGSLYIKSKLLFASLGLNFDNLNHGGIARGIHQSVWIPGFIQIARRSNPVKNYTNYW